MVVGIEHIGSTAVPGLVAKPIIDILIGVRSLRRQSAALRHAFGALGYEYRVNSSTLGEHLVFAKGSEDRRTCYAHVVEFDDLRWQNDLRFRDVLRSDPMLCTTYATLKQVLARKYPTSRRTYTARRASFIRRALDRCPHVTARDADVEHAVAHLRSGGLLIYPTETSYAIGCDATNARAVAEIFRLKGRERGKPLPLIVASRAMAERYARFTPLARQFACTHWPGPFTIVLDAVRAWGQLAPGVVASNGTIAFRVSAHPIARAFSRAIGRPIVSTSANRSGDPTAFSTRAATEALAPTAERLGIALAAFDGGTLPRRLPSTIVDARGAHQIILRPRRLVRKHKSQ